jgi:predicted anti-sigma-YlaC factor YlaD
MDPRDAACGENLDAAVLAAINVPATVVPPFSLRASTTPKSRRLTLRKAGWCLPGVSPALPTDPTITFAVH